MDYRIIWSPEALNQLDQLVHFISVDNPPAAEDVGNVIIQKVLLLSKFPRLGRTFRKLNRDAIREVLVFSYRVIYQIHDDQKMISVLTVWHSARQEPEIQ